MTGMILIAIGVPCLLSLLLTPLVRRWSLRRDFVDRPAGHKQHGRDVALGGGVAFTFAFVAPLLAAALVAAIIRIDDPPTWIPESLLTHLGGIRQETPRLSGILGGALVLHLLGLVDDVRPLGAGIRLVVELVVAAIIVVGFDVRLLQFLPPAASVVLTVIWIVLITNAFNFLDNMDGLAAGVGVIAASIFAAAAFGAGQLFVPLTALMLAGALLGFLPYNFAPASIHMGDAGSMVIGYLLAVLTVLTTFYQPDAGMKPYALLVPVTVLAVPLYDVISVCAIRIRAGDSPFRGDRRHFSHRLTRRGLSVRQAVMTIYLATATTATSALILPHAYWFLACVVFAQVICVVLIIAILEGAGSRT